MINVTQLVLEWGTVNIGKTFVSVSSTFLAIYMAANRQRASHFCVEFSQHGVIFLPPRLLELKLEESPDLSGCT